VAAEDTVVRHSASASDRGERLADGTAIRYPADLAEANQPAAADTYRTLSGRTLSSRTLSSRTPSRRCHIRLTMMPNPYTTVDE